MQSTENGPSNPSAAPDRRGLCLLVTGGAGFIGYHLCDLLLRQGHRVLCLDNFVSSEASSLEGLPHGERFRLIVHDVSQPLEVDEPLDGIFHLATPASPRLFHDRPVEVARAAALGTAVMLELAGKHHCRFLLASSDTIYGDSPERPQKETTLGWLDHLGPRSAYDEGKRFAEALTRAYQVQEGVNAGIARPFHSYGERMPNDGRLLPVYIAQALHGKPLLVMGTGDQTRAFCHISDVVEGMVALFHSAYQGPVNLGSPHEISILSLARLIIALAGSDSRIQFAPALEGDRGGRCPDISLAARVLGWQPRVPLEEGLRKTIEWAKRGRVAPVEEVV